MADKYDSWFFYYGPDKCKSASASSHYRYLKASGHHTSDEGKGSNIELDTLEVSNNSDKRSTNNTGILMESILQKRATETVLKVPHITQATTKTDDSADLSDSCKTAFERATLLALPGSTIRPVNSHSLNQVIVESFIHDAYTYDFVTQRNFKQCIAMQGGHDPICYGIAGVYLYFGDSGPYEKYYPTFQALANAALRGF